MIGDIDIQSLLPPIQLLMKFPNEVCWCLGLLVPELKASLNVGNVSYGSFFGFGCEGDQTIDVSLQFLL